MVDRVDAIEARYRASEGYVRITQDRDDVGYLLGVVRKKPDVVVRLENLIADKESKVVRLETILKEFKSEAPERDWDDLELCISDLKSDIVLLKEVLNG